MTLLLKNNNCYSTKRFVMYYEPLESFYQELSLAFEGYILERMKNGWKKSQFV